MNNYKKNIIREQKGITLIALVITIIVLLILAGVSIAMLTGNNGLVQKASDAKELTGIAEVENILKLEKEALMIQEKVGGEKVTIEKVIEETNRKINEKEWLIELKTQSPSAFYLSKTDIILGTEDGINTTKLIIEGGETSEAQYYAKIYGKYYKIENDSLVISRTETPSNLFVSEETASGETTTITVDNAIVTATLGEDNKTITLIGKKESEEPIDLVVKKGEQELIAKVSVINGFIATYLDGAMLLGQTTSAENNTISNSEITMDGKYNNIIEITNEGILKCNQKEGDAIVIIGETKYRVTSTAKKVFTQTGTSAPISGTASYDNPTVPRGFTAIDTADAKWNRNGKPTKENLNNGLVIMDDNGNQFVWVPVPNAIYDENRKDELPISKSEGTKNGKTYTPLAINVSSGGPQDGKFYENNEYNGILYISGREFGASEYSRYLDFPNGTNFQGNYKEPVVLSCDGKAYLNTRTPVVEVGTEDSIEFLSIIRNILINNADKYSNIVKFEETLQKEYNLMINSVLNYGGFYIGRYESSLLNEKTRSVSGSHSMVWSCSDSYMWYGLYARQMRFSEDNGLSSNVKSSMIWGSQFDAVLNWFDVGGCNRGSSQNTTRIGGSDEGDKWNNIYDLYGNSNEQTMEGYREAGSMEWSRRIDRSRNCNIPPSYAAANSTMDSRGIEKPYGNSGTFYHGSRVTLYID